MTEKIFPVENFEEISWEEVNSLVGYWKEILGLNDWLIGINILSRDEMKVEDHLGISHIDLVHKTNCIDLIRRGFEPQEGRIFKTPHEATLVHELLHCLIPFSYFTDTKTLEGKFFESKEHELIVQLTRTFLTLKYNLNPEWFINKPQEDSDNLSEILNEHPTSIKPKAITKSGKIYEKGVNE